MTNINVPEHIKIKIEQFTPFQRAYCEWRARNMSQANAAQKAGSSATDKASLARVGFQVEQADGAREYIDWLKDKRTSTSVIDGIEVISMLQKVYDEAMKSDKTLKEANKAAELIGEAIGLFGKQGGLVTESTKKKDDPLRTNTEAFLEEDDTAEDNEAKRVRLLQKRLKDLEVSNK
jgi:hypothetical protein